MRIKTLRIKVESNDQDYFVDDFFFFFDTSFTTNAQLVKEGKDYYWHVLIAYADGSKFKPATKKRVVNTSYFDAITQLLKENPPKYGLTKNVVGGNMDYIYEFRTIYDFKKLRSFGLKSIEKDREFLEKVIEIVIKYNSY